VGKLGIMDFDRVDTSNLQRQIIHTTSRVGVPKVESAKIAISEINPHVQVQTYETSLRSDNALEILKDYDVVLDGTDNFATRYLVNDACVLLKKPNVYGSIFRFDGQVTTFWAEHGPCYRCLYPQPPDAGLVPSCAEGGVLGVLPGIVGILQATETIKILLGLGNLLIGRLLLVDALSMKFREMKLRKDPNCPICSANPTQTELIDYNQFCGTPPPDSPARRLLSIPLISATELKSLIDHGTEFDLVDVREPHEAEICSLPQSKLIPVGTLSQQLHQLDTARPIVIYCKGEMRSEQAFRTLQQAGFKKIQCLEGGIESWAKEVDPTLPMY
jgi:adenylyltransferase/sulfurtransferase